MARLFAVLFCMVSLTAVAEVYRSVDADGGVTYSDQPGPGSEKVKLPQVMTYSPPPLPQREEAAKPPAEPPAYEKMSILAPKSDDTIWDNQGIVELVVSLEPDLMVSKGHRIRITVDGTTHGEPRATTRIHFADLDRGTHDIGASVIDGNGKSLIAAKPVTFHLHRQSVLFPNRRPAPLPPTP